jgi:HJR/Mrr/RecB family endonuclease
MSPTQFETCCADYLKLRGWQAHTTKGSGDQGADVIARKNGRVLVIQCKKYSKPVGNKAVQEVFAAKAYVNAHVAAVVSNQTYTKSAHELARRTNVLLLHFTDLKNF